jgi:hypothetical protein
MIRVLTVERENGCGAWVARSSPGTYNETVSDACSE